MTILVNAPMSGLPIFPAIGDKLKKYEKEVTRTVLECKKCNETNRRDYLDGDTVFGTGKDTDRCPSCREVMLITQVFVEVIDTRKSRKDSGDPSPKEDEAGKRS